MATTPNHCWECEYSHVCTAAYYGSSTCYHSDAINARGIEQILHGEKTKKEE